jgi:hypothetical protein
MRLAALAGHLQPTYFFLSKNNAVGGFEVGCGFLRVTRTPQRSKKLNEINRCGLRVLAAPTGRFRHPQAAASRRYTPTGSCTGTIKPVSRDEDKVSVVFKSDRRVWIPQGRRGRNDLGDMAV